MCCIHKVLLLLLLLSRFSRVQLCATPWMAAHQAPPSLGCSRQEHWSGLPFPSPMHESEKWKGSRSVMSDSRRPQDCSLPGSSVHGICQARVLEWGTIAFSRTLFYCWIVVSAIITFFDWLVFLFHFLHPFTSPIVTFLSLLFGTQRRPRRLKLFLQTRTGDMKGFLYLGGPCRVLLSFTGTSQDQWRSNWLEPGSGCSVTKWKRA